MLPHQSYEGDHGEEIDANEPRGPPVSIGASAACVSWLAGAGGSPLANLGFSGVHP